MHPCSWRCAAVTSVDALTSASPWLPAVVNASIALQFGATLGVFGISAAIHELILCCAFRFVVASICGLIHGAA